MSYKVKDKLRELRTEWREGEIAEDNRKKKEYRKAVHQEEADRRHAEDDHQYQREIENSKTWRTL
eukprot:18293-Amphidinium_carterae.2